MKQAIAALALTVGLLGIAPSTAKADGFGFGFSFGDRHRGGYVGFSDGYSGGCGGYTTPTYYHEDDCCRPCGHWEYRCESYIVTCGYWDRVWVNGNRDSVWSAAPGVKSWM